MDSNEPGSAREVTLVINQQDDRYGTGVLRIKVHSVDTANAMVFEGDRWVWVEETQMTANGAQIKRRRVLVRASCLRRPPPA